MSEKTRVLVMQHIISPYRLPLFEELQKKYDVHVYFLKKKTKDRKWEATTKGYHFANTVLPSFMIGPFFANPTLPFALWKENPDVYLIGECPEMFFSTWTTVFIAKLRRKPLIIWSEAQNDEIHYYPQLWKPTKGFYKLIKNILTKGLRVHRKALYQLADRHMAYSQGTRKLLMQYGIERERIDETTQVMPPEQLLKPNVNKRQTEYKNRFVILSLGYLTKRKGIDYLIKGYIQMVNQKHLKEIIRKKKPILIIAGTGEDEKRLKEIAQGREDIRFVGYANEKKRANLYSIADVFVLPTILDAWGLVVNEALYYGVPVITTTAAGASELIENGKTGLLISRESSEDIAKALSRSIINDERLKKMQRFAGQQKTAWNIKIGVRGMIEGIEKVTHGESRR